MIKVKKQQLKFLEVYQLWANKDQSFQISGEQNLGTIIFSQQSDKGFLITEFPYSCNIDINFNFDTDTFVALIKSLKEDTEVTITETGIEFGGSKYDIKNQSVIFNDASNYLNLVKSNSGSKINLVDIDKFSYVKNSIGGEGLNTVCYQNNHFVTSDRINYTSFVKVGFSHAEEIYFSSDLFILLNLMSIKEKEITIYDDFYSCKVDDTHILIMNKKYILPNMFDPSIIAVYQHPIFFQVTKSELKKALDRMSIVARTNKETRIYLELAKNELIIKNIDSQFASESIPAKIPSDIEGVKIPISVTYFSKVIAQLSGNIIRCYCTSDMDSFVASKIEDETQNNFYALNLLEG